MASSKILGEAKSFDGTDPGAAAENELKPLSCDLWGGLHVNIGQPYHFQTFTSYSTITASTLGGLLASSASNALYVTDIIMSADTGPATFSFYTNFAATSPTEVLRFYVPANCSMTHQFRQPYQVATLSSFGLSTSALKYSQKELGTATR
jgi:hypothetical protein